MTQVAVRMESQFSFNNLASFGERQKNTSKFVGNDTKRPPVKIRRLGVSIEEIHYGVSAKDLHRNSSPTDFSCQ